MYKPEKFQVQDVALLLRIVREFPFATVISVAEGEPFVSHLPLIARVGTDNRVVLVGHVSKKNPQWRHFRSGSEAKIVFHGPHAYISPLWYQKNDVPTWNYIVVQATGPVRLVEDAGGIQAALRELNDQMNSIYEERWDFDLPPDLASDEALQDAIVAFEIEARDFVGKFKLSQNRSSEDKAGVVNGLATRVDEGSAGIRHWMSSLLE